MVDPRVKKWREEELKKPALADDHFFYGCAVPLAACVIIVLLTILWS